MKGLCLVFTPQNKVLFFKVKPTLGADPCSFAGVLASDIHENRRSCVALLSPHQWIHYEEHKELFSSKRKTPGLQKKKSDMSAAWRVNYKWPWWCRSTGAEVDASLILSQARRSDSQTRTQKYNKDGDNVDNSLLGCVPKQQSYPEQISKGTLCSERQLCQTAEMHCSADDPCEQTFTKDRGDICVAGEGTRDSRDASVRALRTAEGSVLSRVVWLHHGPK